MSEQSDSTRKAPRVTLSVPLQVTWLDSANRTITETMRTENVSKIGAFLITSRTLQVGVVLKLESANRRFVGSEEVLAKVVSIAQKRKLAGLGVKIIKGQETWKQLITSL